MQFNARLQLKRDTAANWEQNNPVLLLGELIIVTTNAGETRLKIGDGSKTYTQLPFADEYLRTLISAIDNRVDEFVPMTNEEIDEICGTTIYSANEVTF